MSDMFNIYPPSAHNVYKKMKLTFHPTVDKYCDEIYKACKGVGTDEKALIKVLGPLSPEERAMVAYRYKELQKKDLKDLLSSETSGDFGYLLQLIAVPLPEAEAYIIYQACKGSGTSEELIYPVVMGRTNDEMSILKKAFFERYNKDLAVMLDDELSGDLKKVIMAAVQAPMVEFNSSFHSNSKAEEDADRLYKAGQGKWGTDEEPFIKVLVSSPPKHLANVNEVYNKKYKNSIKVAIEKEFGGDAKRALLYFIRLALEPAEMLAEHVESTMKGMGTDEKGLAGAIVRYHAYMSAVKKSYEKMYKKSLKDRIHGETSGDYRELIIAVLNAPSTPSY